jgi:hypothetical protein
MGSDLTNAFAIYPMVEEHEATGRVAGVYNQILESMPFVPSLFKSLATCPGYLVLAWDQAPTPLPMQRSGTGRRRCLPCAGKRPWRRRTSRSVRSSAASSAPSGECCCYPQAFSRLLRGGCPESSPGHELLPPARCGLKRSCLHSGTSTPRRSMGRSARRSSRRS